MAWFEKDHFGHLRAPSDRLASQFDWATPNLITLFGALLVGPMAYAFWTNHVAVGLVLFLAGIFTDVLDGPLARFQEAKMNDIERKARDVRGFFWRRGQTMSGAAFDPFVDKLRFFGAILPLGWYLLWWPMLAACVAFAVLITVGRLFVRAKANKFGKIKAIAETVLVVFMAAFNLVPIGMFTWRTNDVLLTVADVILAVATVLGSLSFFGQIYTWLKRKDASS